MTTDHRQHAPATLRNREAIAAVLAEVLPPSGLVLEVASGTGEHMAFLARRFDALAWQPSDLSATARRSIQGWTEGIANVHPPVELDAESGAWPVAAADAVICINLVHISRWAATEGLMRGAARVLPAGAPLYLYGPFRRPEVPLEPSNAAFDADLRRRDPTWGLRDLDEVGRCAASHGLDLERTVAMPANNLSVIFRKRED